MTIHERIESWRGGVLQQPNWDSYQAAPVTSRTLDVAIEVARRLDGMIVGGRAMDYVGPTRDGGVEFSDGDESVWVRVMTCEPDEGE